MDERRRVLRKIIMAGLFAAIICVVTFVSGLLMPRMANGGYVNLGDTVIYMTASLLSPVFAMFAAGIGSGLADVFMGAGPYIIPTILIKGLMGLVCGFIAKEGNFSRYALSCITGGLIMLGGYFIFEAFVLRLGIEVAVSYLLVNMLQFFGGILFALVLYSTLPRLKKSLNTFV